VRDCGSCAAPLRAHDDVGAAADTAGQIDVMVVWTPAARNAVGGTTAAAIARGCIPAPDQRDNVGRVLIS